MQNKEYIKNLIIRGFKGKLDQSEIQQIKTELTNYSREDLRALKNICKELAKEAINEQFDKEFNLPIE
jgi:predicted DNA binding CopG/RHH family protein